MTPQPSGCAIVPVNSLTEQLERKGYAVPPATDRLIYKPDRVIQSDFFEVATIKFFLGRLVANLHDVLHGRLA